MFVIMSIIARIYAGDKSESNTLTRFDTAHVDDVTRAQIFLFENPKAKGRYNCSANIIEVESTAKLLSTKYPGLKFPCKGSV